MTKKEEKPIITWRFRDLPSVGEVNELVTSGVLTIEEARQILIKEQVPKSNEEEIEALKEMVRTLQETVKDLIDRPATQIFPLTRVIEVPQRMRPYWLNTFETTTPGTLTVAAGSGNLVTYSMSDKL